MKHKVVAKTFLSAFMAFIFVGATVAIGIAADFVSVAKDGVNLRSGPGTNYEVIYQLPANYPLQVLSRKGQWVKVEDFEGDKGWIFDTLISSSSYVIVKVEEGNVRTGPGTNFEKAGSVFRDVILKKVSTKGEWIQVSHPKLQGWIYGNLVWP